jgi:hypothetical protein
MKGIGNSPLSVTVYEYTDSISNDSLYYSAEDVSGKYREPALGTGLVRETDSLVKVEITDVEFINKFLTAEDSILEYTEALWDLVNGLYITCEDALTEGDGGFTLFDWTTSDHWLTFYYRNDSLDSLRQQYFMGSGTVGINLFQHDHSGYPIEAYINSGTENDDLMFVQSMGGVSSVIRITGFDSWKDSVPVAIMNARLTIPVVDSNLTQQDYVYRPEKINILRRVDSRYLVTYDEILLSNSSGGEYNPEENAYVFEIKVHLQSVINGDIEDTDLYLRPFRNSETVSRTVLHGLSSDPEKRMKFQIIYTRL